MVTLPKPSIVKRILITSERSTNKSIYDFRLPSRSRRDLRSSGTLRSGNSLLTFQEALTLEEGTDRLSRNVSKELPLYAVNISEERRSQD